ncbi:MAG: hypothetical protein GTO22_26395 [Gemmatimonadales bacterium]|nr:hypothetical protein [Gemmatimonadales bacterium]
MSNFPATSTVAGILTAAQFNKLDGSSGIMHIFTPSTPNDVVNMWGDGSATGRGLNFMANQTAVRLRVSFRIDQASQLDIRVRLFKYDDGTASSILLASVAQAASGTTNTWVTLEQLVSAGPNPGEATIETADFIYVTLDDSAGAVVKKASQIVTTVEVEPV